MKGIFVLSITLFVAGCTTTGPTQPDFQPSRVIERMGSVSETPSWATGAEPISEEKGDLVFVHTITMSGDTRTEACTNAAGEKGRAEFVRHIKDAITSSGQLSETSGTADPGIEEQIAHLAQMKLSGAKVAARYWEKVEESDSQGSRVLRIRCAAKVAIPKTLLAKQLRDATDQGGGNAEIRKKLIDAQSKFLENVGKEGSENTATPTEKSTEKTDAGE